MTLYTMLEVALAIEASIAHNPFNVKCLIVQDLDNSRLHKSYYIVHIFVLLLRTVQLSNSHHCNTPSMRNEIETVVGRAIYDSNE